MVFHPTKSRLFSVVAERTGGDAARLDLLQENRAIPKLFLCWGWMSLLVGFALVGCSNRPSPPPANAPSENARLFEGDRIRSQGRMLPTSGIVMISALPGDRVEEILVRPGAQVIKGQPLVRLASERAKQNELALAKQKWEEAKLQANAKLREAKLLRQTAVAQQEQAEKQYAQTLKQASLVDDSKSQLEIVEKQIGTLQKLREDPRTRAMIGSLELEQRKLELGQLSSKQQQASLATEQAKFAAEMAVEIAKQRLEAAEESLRIVETASSLRSLEMHIELLELQIATTRVTAGSVGTILEIQSKVGESVSTLPLLTMADLTNMSCLAEVYEGNVGRVMIGDRVEMRSAALSKSIQGTVERIDRLVGMPQMRLPNPMAKTDFRAVPVWIKVDPDDVEVAAKLVQLQVDVLIESKP